MKLLVKTRYMHKTDGCIVNSDVKIEYDESSRQVGVEWEVKGTSPYSVLADKYFNANMQEFLGLVNICLSNVDVDISGISSYSVKVRSEFGKYAVVPNHIS